MSEGGEGRRVRLEREVEGRREGGISVCFRLVWYLLCFSFLLCLFFGGVGLLGEMRRGEKDLSRVVRRKVEGGGEGRVATPEPFSPFLSSVPSTQVRDPNMSG